LFLIASARKVIFFLCAFYANTLVPHGEQFGLNTHIYIYIYILHARIV